MNTDLSDGQTLAVSDAPSEVPASNFDELVHSGQTCNLNAILNPEHMNASARVFTVISGGMILDSVLPFRTEAT